MSSSGKVSETLTGNPNVNVSNSLLLVGTNSSGTYLNNVSASTTSSSINLISGHVNATLYVIQNSTTVPTSISTVLQGSIDNVNWYALATQSNTANGAYVVNSNSTVFQYVRVQTTITGGTGVTVTAQVGIAN